MAKEEIFKAIGRRKRSVARVILKKGTGKITVNKREVLGYFNNLERLKIQIEKPFTVTETLGKFDVNVRLNGGGLTGQADALKLGIARALIQVDQSLRTTLKKQGLLTRDSRIVERKKYGLCGARKSFQFSKR